MKENNNTTKDHLKTLISDTFYVWRKEMIRVVRDQGVLIFFILVPLLYPLLYAFIYTNETVHEVPVIAVDQSHSALSRDFLRRVDAAPDLHIVTYASDMKTAQEMMRRQKAYGTILIPEDFSSRLNRGEQATVATYTEMSGLLYYKAILSVCTDVSLDMNKEIQIKRSGNTTNRQDDISTAPLTYEYVPMFNPTNGFACFLIPAVLILIIQQTLLLGVGLINGSARERRTFHRQVIPGNLNGTGRIVAGKSLCYLMIYALMSAWLLLVVPHIFQLPQIGQIWELMAFMVPYLLACIFFAMTLSIFVFTRESCMPLFVFTSVPLLFISGISWPGFSIPEYWRIISWIFPSTFGINGFIRINSMGALLDDVSTEYTALWIQTGIYFVTACFVYHYLIRESRENRKKETTQKEITTSFNSKSELV